MLITEKDLRGLKCVNLLELENYIKSVVIIVMKN
jgi:hypothetical protein